MVQRAIRGVFWSAIERFSTQGIQFILGILVSRLIDPSEYGLIAMLGIYLAVAQVFIDSGFSNALIQKIDRTETDFATVFYFSTLTSALMYLALVLFSPYIASFYHQPLLEPLLKYIGIGLILSGLSVVQRTVVTINLDFKLLAQISFLSVLISGCIGIVLAFLGYGVWALATQMLLNNVVSTLLIVLKIHWIPSKRFSIQSFKTLFSFGVKLLIGGLLHVVYVNLYTLIIGRRFSAIDVGVFNRAQTFATFPSLNLTYILSRPFYPLLCEMQNNKTQIELLFLRYIRMSAYLIFPLMISLSVLSEPLIKILLTDKWLLAAPLLSILCLSYMCYPIMNINWQILNARGRSDLSLKSELIKKIIAFILLFLTMPFGVKMMCWGLVLYSVIDIIIVVFYVNKIISVGFKTQTLNIIPILLISLLMGGVVYFVALLFMSPYLKLFIGFLLGLIVYIMASFLFKFSELFYVVNILKKRKLLNKLYNKSL